jgi:hypothetical protein
MFFETIFMADLITRGEALCKQDLRARRRVEKLKEEQF